jgi:hypothetical protein
MASQRRTLSAISGSTSNMPEESSLRRIFSASVEEGISILRRMKEVVPIMPNLEEPIF